MYESAQMANRVGNQMVSECTANSSASRGSSWRCEARKRRLGHESGVWASDGMRRMAKKGTK